MVRGKHNLIGLGHQSRTWTHTHLRTPTECYKKEERISQRGTGRLLQRPFSLNRLRLPPPGVPLSWPQAKQAAGQTTAHLPTLFPSSGDATDASISSKVFTRNLFNCRWLYWISTRCNSWSIYIIRINFLRQHWDVSREKVHDSATPSGGISRIVVSCTSVAFRAEWRCPCCCCCCCCSRSRRCCRSWSHDWLLILELYSCASCCIHFLSCPPYCDCCSRGSCRCCCWCRLLSSRQWSAMVGFRDLPTRSCVVLVAAVLWKLIGLSRLNEKPLGLRSRLSSKHWPAVMQTDEWQQLNRGDRGVIITLFTDDAVFSDDCRRWSGWLEQSRCGRKWNGMGKQKHTHTHIHKRQG